jgi:hypothetical protein
MLIEVIYYICLEKFPVSFSVDEIWLTSCFSPHNLGANHTESTGCSLVMSLSVGVEMRSYNCLETAAFLVTLDDCSAQVFPYNIFAYCSICRVDCKFARNKITKNYSSCQPLS